MSPLVLLARQWSFTCSSQEQPFRSPIKHNGTAIILPQIIHVRIPACPNLSGLPLSTKSSALNNAHETWVHFPKGVENRAAFEPSTPLTFPARILVRPENSASLACLGFSGNPVNDDPPPKHLTGDEGLEIVLAK